MPPSLSPPHQPLDPDRPATLLETDEDLRKALQAGKPAPPATGPSAQGRPASLPAAIPYRPTARPPTAILTVLDDGKTEGEVIRIRGSRFVIGRTEGDLVLPHDGMISGRHLEITRQKVGDSYRWVVTDLQTTNGLFVRVSRIALASGAEFLVGQGRYRFEMSAPSPPAETAAPGAELGATQPWGTDASALLGGASLLEVMPSGPGARVALARAEYWIGSDPSCGFRRTADPFVEPRHVRLSRDAKGGWQAQNNKSVNGLWLRVPQVTVENGCLFQIGEQRLRLKVGE
jgi:pSer/pThr/pTyr-binding forkhead associated (FHA) protein